MTHDTAATRRSEEDSLVESPPLFHFEIGHHRIVIGQVRDRHIAVGRRHAPVAVHRPENIVEAHRLIDGVAEDPRRCRFDIQSLRCRPGVAAGCLSEEQVAFARQFYAPLKDPSGRALDRGLLPGVLVDSGRSRLAPATFAQAIRRVAEWDGKDFDAGRDLAAIDRVMPELRADDADLSAFRARGGKAIFYEGWMDPAVSANMIVDYQQAVETRLGGEAAAAQFERLFMVPGMLHCQGGAGPDQFGGSGGDAPTVDPQHDLLSALEDWVEHGRAPERIVASKLDGGRVMRTRPLCAWPTTARYAGKGSTDDAASFVCERPR